MRLPITIVEKNGDTTVCASVHEAEIQMEPVDVENGEYVVSDADGCRLCVEVVTARIPVFWGLWKSALKKVRITDTYSKKPPPTPASR